MSAADARLGAALADYLHHADESDLAQLRAVSLAGLSPGQRDQIEAAEREGHDLVTRVGALLGHRGGEVALAAVPFAVFAPLLETLSAWTGGRAQTCLHNPVAAHPQPVYAAAWRPGLVTCAGCQHLFHLASRSDAAHRCDLCGVVDRGGMTAHGVQYGVITFWVGTCTGCRLSREVSPGTAVADAQGSAPTRPEGTTR